MNDKLIGNEPRVRRITHKNTRPVLIALPEKKDDHRLLDIKALISANCPKKRRTLLQAFNLMKP